jgi:hypothetical protein
MTCRPSRLKFLDEYRIILQNFAELIQLFGKND